MPRQLSEKSKIIRQAISDDLNVGNTDLAKFLNAKHPDLNVTMNDVAAQRQQMKRQEGQPSLPLEAPAPSPSPAPRLAEVVAERIIHEVNHGPAGGLTTEDLETLRALVQKVGGVDNLIRWLEMLRSLR